MSTELDPRIEETIRFIQHFTGAITLAFNTLILMLIIGDRDSRNKDYRKYLCCLQITSMAIDTLSDSYAPIFLFNKGLRYSDSFLSNAISFWHFYAIELLLMAQLGPIYFACVYYRRGIILPKEHLFNYFGWRRKVLFGIVEAYLLTAVFTMLHFLHKSMVSAEPLLPPELYWAKNKTVHMYMVPDANSVHAFGVFFPVEATLLSAIIAMLVQIKLEVKRGMAWTSRATRRYQQLAVRSLILQGALPTLFYAIPGFGMICLLFASTIFEIGEDFDRNATSISPILYIIMTRHAFVNSLTVLYCSPSYRQKIVVFITKLRIIPVHSSASLGAYKYCIYQIVVCTLLSQQCTWFGPVYVMPITGAYYHVDFTDDPFVTHCVLSVFIGVCALDIEAIMDGFNYRMRVLLLSFYPQLRNKWVWIGFSVGAKLYSIILICVLFVPIGTQLQRDEMRTFLEETYPNAVATFDEYKSFAVYDLRSLKGLVECVVIVIVSLLFLIADCWIAIAIIFRLLHLQRGSMSAATRKMHRAFVFQLSVQGCVPFVVLICPLASVILFVIFDFPFQTDLAGYLILVMLMLHGPLASTLTIALYEPYRKAVVKFIRGKVGRDAIVPIDRRDPSFSSRALSNAGQS